MQQLGLLSVVIWLPIAGGLVTLGFGDQRARAARWAALVSSLLTLAACVPLYAGFANGTAKFQFTERLTCYLGEANADERLPQRPVMVAAGLFSCRTRLFPRAFRLGCHACNITAAAQKIQLMLTSLIFMLY